MTKTNNLIQHSLPKPLKMPSSTLARPSAYIIITSSTALTWSILVLLIRIFLRVKVNGPFGLDDISCAAATVFSLIAAILAIIQAHLGLGGAIESSSSAGHEILLLGYISTFSYLIGIHLSQLSMCFLLARITKAGRQVWISYGIGCVSAVLAGVFVFLMAFRCRLPRPWERIQEKSECINQWKAWMVYTAMQALLEIAITAAAILLVWPLNMRMKSKVIVIKAFSVRLLIIPPAAVRVKYTYIALYSADWTRDRTNTAIITQIVLHLSVILATLPCIKPWLAVLELGGLKMSTTAATQLPICQARAENQEVRLDRVDGWQGALDGWRPDHARTVTNVRYDAEGAHAAARKRSLNSSESSRNAVHRTDSFKVESHATRDESKAAAQRVSLETARRSSRNTVHMDG
ncbi:Hypothetical protein R9X50_00744700 [Acrodontium crateriforme]|uniref:Rhodopsin domain-containing protein n=1 Tax=Acrodontium crateriforme TaxID=150365 RepID=A0AAQ3MB48_9PEZI|nr:Hypothetical protein R9X50_00744700 [Acrodontium crateriforme]